MQVSEEAQIPGSTDLAWALVTEPRHVQTWYAFGGANIDPRPGGAMLLRWEEHGEYPAVVEEVIAGRLLSLRWLPEPGPLVEITLQPDGDSTRVRIVETGELEDSEQSALAWRNALALLRLLAQSVRLAG